MKKLIFLIFLSLILTACNFHKDKAEKLFIVKKINEKEINEETEKEVIKSEKTDLESKKFEQDDQNIDNNNKLDEELNNENKEDNKEEDKEYIEEGDNIIVYNEEETQEKNNEYYQVIRIIDGDTIDVIKDKKIIKIRLIGINTPEIIDPRKSVKCLGEKASQKAQEWLLGKLIKLENDPTQGDKDKYGRFLRYVIREDGFFYNLEIIKNGYAYEYTYKVPYKYQKEFKKAQKYAKENKLGFWGNEVCE